MSCARRFAAAAFVLGFAVSAGCGIPLDDSPRAVASPTTTIPSGVAQGPFGGQPVFLYYLRANALYPWKIEVEKRVTPTRALNALFRGMPTDVPREVVTQIPPGARLLSVKVNDTDRRIDVNVSHEFGDQQGEGQSAAVGQIVLTATNPSGYERYQVALLIEGSSTQVFSMVRGDVDTVTACDFLPLIPEASSTTTPSTSTTTNAPPTTLATTSSTTSTPRNRSTVVTSAPPPPTTVATTTTTTTPESESATKLAYRRGLC